MDYLSGTELYFSENVKEDCITISGDDFKHITKIMRHKVEDEIYITNGRGEIFLSTIKEIKKDLLIVVIKKTLKYNNQFSNFIFCLPALKNNDRLELALEKCTELGITNFIIFDSERVIRKSLKTDRLQKIVLSAMKQSLRSYIPEVKIYKSLDEICESAGRKIIFDQSAVEKFLPFKIKKEERYYFIFGPEGGFTENELNMFEEKYKLAENRLRTETAVIKCASVINGMVE